MQLSSQPAVVNAAENQKSNLKLTKFEKMPSQIDVVLLMDEMGLVWDGLVWDGLV